MAEKDAGDEEREPLCPWTSVVCFVYSGLTAFGILLCLVSTNLASRWVRVDAEEVSHAGIAVLLIISAVVAEVCFLTSSSWNRKLLGSEAAGILKLHSSFDSVLTLAEYGIKIATALYISCFEGGWVHTDAQAFGGARPVYFARFAQWSVAVPILVLIGNRAFLGASDAKVFMCRSAPSVIAAFFYVWAAWVMEVTANPMARWTMFVTSFVGVALVAIDQLNLAYHHRGDQTFGLKLGMLIYEIFTFALYAAAFVCGRFGLVSSLSEQKFYAYGDATIKVFQAAILAMIRNREDIHTIHHWWRAALSAHRDLENVVRKAMLPVFALDLDFRITHWNHNLVELTGMTLKDVKGKLLLDLVPDETKEPLKKLMAQVISEAGQEDGEDGLLMVRTKSGRDLHRAQSHLEAISIVAPNGTSGAKAEGKVVQLAMSLVPKSTEEGAVAGLMAIGQDLSEISELKLTQEKKSVLMGMLSHELRSPLHGIAGLAAALLESESGKGIHKQLSMIKGCSARLLDLITNVMDLAQGEKRRRDQLPQPKPTDPVNVLEVMNEVVVMTQLAVDKTNKPLLRPSVRLLSKFSDPVPIIPGDANKLTQLFYNLMTNACKFTESGSITVSARHMPGVKRLEIDVADTGKGISAQGQQTIFEPFTQEGSNGDTRNFQGIGLGLSVCKQVVELHGGEISLVSKLGEGSTFTIALPCDGTMGFSAPPEEVSAASLTADTMSSLHPAAAPRATKAADRKPLVLSVDDDFVNQEVIQGALKGEYEIFCAMNGSEALNFMAERKKTNGPYPDIVLLDIQMPGMDGYQVCTELRSTFESAHLNMPIIMVSARAPQDLAAIQGYNSGSSDFLSKPFNAEVLRNKVRIAHQLKDESSHHNSVVIAADAFERMQSSEVSLKEVQATAERLQTALAEKEAAMAQRQAQLAEEKQGWTRLQEQLAEEESRSRVLQRQVQSLEDEVLKHKSAQLQQKDQQAEADAQQQKLARLEEQVQQLQQQLQKKDAEEVKHRQRVQALEADLQAKVEPAAQKAAGLQNQQQQQPPQQSRSAPAFPSAPEGGKTSIQVYPATESQLPAMLRRKSDALQLQELPKNTPVAPGPIKAIREQKADRGGGVVAKEMHLVPQPASKLPIPYTRAEQVAVQPLVFQLQRAKTTIRVLSTRFEIIQKVVIGCHDLIVLLDAADRESPGSACEQRQTRQVLSSEMEMIEQVAVQSNDLAMLAIQDRSEPAQHLGGGGEAARPQVPASLVGG